LKRIAVFNDTRGEHHYGCRLVMDNLCHLLREQGVEPTWFWPAGRDWQLHRDQLPRRGDVDAVIVNGEGTIHHSATRPRAHWLAAVGRFSHDTLGVPAFLVNATLEANEASLYAALREFDGIFVRERGSLGELARFGLPGTLVPDLTLALAPPVAPAGRAGVLVTDSVLPAVTARLREYSDRHGAEYFTLHYPHRPAPKQLRRPVVYLRRYLAWRAAARAGRLDPGYFVNRIASARFVVSGRFHAVTVALLTGTPFVGVSSNTRKTDSVVEDAFGSRDRLIGLDALGALDVEAHVRFSEEETARLRDYLSRARAATERMVGTIAAACR
jgi:polysaccharide pyruvyl transferase WcaK-like protein